MSVDVSHVTWVIDTEAKGPERVPVNLGIFFPRSYPPITRKKDF